MYFFTYIYFQKIFKKSKNYCLNICAKRFNLLNLFSLAFIYLFIYFYLKIKLNKITAFYFLFLNYSKMTATKQLFLARGAFFLFLIGFFLL